MSSIFGGSPPFCSAAGFAPPPPKAFDQQQAQLLRLAVASAVAFTSSTSSDVDISLASLKRQVEQSTCTQSILLDPYELRHNDEPSLILVTAVESKSPLYIAPPVATHQPDSPEPQSLTGHSSLLTTSPKRTMAQEKDNPFRPDGQLCHEVDPIVKKYTSRPFPESDVVSAQPVDILPPDEGVDGGGGRRSSPDELNKADKLSPIKLNMLNGEQVQTLQAQHKSLASPKAGTLELVHVEPRKKRCGCCSVQ
ncbi:hypothetical protein T10_2827 [Trichinella papuae]|uniref:Uncharacterized protein n=1 Tax=Trichinella papuae TaxID=268474 RepID=A0A0V1MIY3_9BILA|nr:hypothetical protein T10_2827 [Trichinella papuae]